MSYHVSRIILAFAAFSGTSNKLTVYNPFCAAATVLPCNKRQKLTRIRNCLQYLAS